MSSNVAIAIENRKTGAQINKDVPVNGRSDKFAAITGQNSIQATHVVSIPRYILAEHYGHIARMRDQHSVVRKC